VLPEGDGLTEGDRVVSGDGLTSDSSFHEALLERELPQLQADIVDRTLTDALSREAFLDLFDDFRRTGLPKTMAAVVAKRMAKGINRATTTPGPLRVLEEDPSPRREYRVTSKPADGYYDEQDLDYLTQLYQPSFGRAWTEVDKRIIPAVTTVFDDAETTLVIDYILFELVTRSAWIESISRSVAEAVLASGRDLEVLMDFFDRLPRFQVVSSDDDVEGDGLTQPTANEVLARLQDELRGDGLQEPLLGTSTAVLTEPVVYAIRGLPVSYVEGALPIELVDDTGTPLALQEGILRLAPRYWRDAQGKVDTRQVAQAVALFNPLWSLDLIVVDDVSTVAPNALSPIPVFHPQGHIMDFLGSTAFESLEPLQERVLEALLKAYASQA